MRHLLSCLVYPKTTIRRDPRIGIYAWFGIDKWLTVNGLWIWLVYLVMYTKCTADT